MIADLTTTGDVAALERFNDAALPVQPVANVPAYLATRRAVLDCQAEKPLLITLPATVRAETAALCKACFAVLARVKAGSKVDPACAAVLKVWSPWNWELKNFRNFKYDRWVKARDWLVLVNRAKAGAAWVKRDFGLSNAFLDYAAARCGSFKRSDALPEAVRSLNRQWVCGCNHLGQPEVIAGYAEGWEGREKSVIPAGWSIENLRKQLEKRAKYTRAVKAAMHEGIASARAFIPQVRSTREGLRFMEEVQFDDVKCDFRVFDVATGQPVDLWLLIAHDRATTMLLGFGLRPAAVREDGSQEHLKLQDMKQLAGWVLERYGLPPYVMTWKLEHGTATLSEGSVGALTEFLPGRLNISFSAMIGGRSPNGYLERALGNSKGKASLESHNRIGHLIGAGLPGQTGPRYDVRPKDLAARERECITLWKSLEELSPVLREKFFQHGEWPLLTLQQARKALLGIFNVRNSRTDHNLEGFEQKLEQRGGRIVRRMESPAERAQALRAGVAFDPVSPEIITAFYEHTQRVVKVTPAGEIEFSHEKRKLTFANPQPPGEGIRPTLAPGAKLLAYFHPDDPRFLHLTTGNGAIIGTWLRRALVRAGDQAALSAALAYANGALKAVKERAAVLGQGEADRLNGMRARNAELLETESFIEVASSESQVQNRTVTSPLATVLTSTPRTIKQNLKAAADADDAIDAALRNAVQ
jgi:hypothetical protein